MIAESSFHRWRNPQRLVNPAEVVMHEIQRNHVAVVLQLLAESIRQASEAPHGHAHREILALNE
jgi:predicted methyltransferase